MHPFSLAYEEEREIEKIKELVLENLKEKKGKKIRVDTKRSDKSFPLNSMEVNKQVGQLLKDNGFLTQVLEILEK
mgnify:CR=1 FL=1